jgi:glycosyltransferase involved in cell wall biosynthesis
METLRLLWLNWRDIANPDAGGAELYTHQVATRLARNGHEVTLFTSRYHGCKMQEESNGVNIVRRGNAATVYLECARHVLTTAKRKIPHDVVVDAVNTVPFFSPAYERDVPIIALIYQLTSEIFLKELPPPLGHLLYALERRYYIPWYCESADHLVVLSDSNKAELCNVCTCLDPEKVSVAPPGVDHAEFTPARKAEVPTILFMNRLVRYKQPEHLILAMKEINDHVPEARLTMVGTSANREYAWQLQHLVNTLGLGSRVSFVLSQAFKPSKISLLQGAWIHVLPSMKEGFGLSILEAAACGTPTVGYDVPGVRDAVVQGKTGMLVKPGDSDALAKCLIHLLADRRQLASLGQQAVRWACNFRWENTTNQFISILRAI